VLLVWLCSAVLIVGGALAAWSCSGPQRRAAVATVVDCTTAELTRQSDALLPLALDAVSHGNWAALERAAEDLSPEIVGCAAARAVEQLTAPRPTSFAGPSAPDAGTVRAGWEQLRDGALGGRRFGVAGGLL